MGPRHLFSLRAPPPLHHGVCFHSRLPSWAHRRVRTFHFHACRNWWLARLAPLQVTLLESHLSEDVSGATCMWQYSAIASVEWVQPNTCVKLSVCEARGDDKAIKPHMSNINCFDLFPLRLMALCRRGTLLIWSQNSVKVCKNIRKCRKNNEGEFYSRRSPT